MSWLTIQLIRWFLVSYCRFSFHLWIVFLHRLSRMWHFMSKLAGVHRKAEAYLIAAPGQSFKCSGKTWLPLYFDFYVFVCFSFGHLFSIMCLFSVYKMHDILCLVKYRDTKGCYNSTCYFKIPSWQCIPQSSNIES